MKLKINYSALIKQDRYRHLASVVIIMLGLLIALEIISAFSLLLLNIRQWPLPGASLILLREGFLAPPIISILLLSIVIFVIVGWIWGGKIRSISTFVGIGLVASLIAAWFGLWVFSVWEGLEHIPKIWELYWLFYKIPSGSSAYSRLWITVAGAEFLLILGVLGRYISQGLNPNNIFGNAHFCSLHEIGKMGLFCKDGIVLGKIHGKTLRLGGFESVLLVAPMGSGKTTSMVIPNLIEWQGSGIFNDIKGELYQTTAKYRELALQNQCYCWSPADPSMSSHRYNPFYYVSQNPNLRIRDIQLIAETLIPTGRDEAKFWTSSSREIFVMLALYLFETKGMATLAEIHDISKQQDFVDWLEYQVAENVVNDLVFQQNAASLLSADKDRTQKNIIKDFHAHMSLFSDPLVRYATSGNDFDLSKIRMEKMSIYIHIPDSDKERLRPILTLFWAHFTHLMTQKEPNIQEEPYPVLIGLDEFGNMGKISKLKDGMSFLRSYRIRAIVIVQYLSQIISVYGHHDAKGFLNAKVRIAYAVNDYDDAKFFSLALGEKTVKVKSRGTSSGVHYSSSENTSMQSRPLMRPDEIMKLNKKKEIILIESENPVKANKCYWFKNRTHKNLLNMSQNEAEVSIDELE